MLRWSRNIRMYHEFVDRIDSSVPRVTVWHNKALPNDAISEPRDRFVYPFLKLKMDSFSCKLLGASA